MQGGLLSLEYVLRVAGDVSAAWDVATVLFSGHRLRVSSKGRTMKVKLVMFRRDGQRKDFPISGRKVVIGRGEECGLRVPLLSVSRTHCELTKGQDELRVKDLASSNGTYVNNRRINDAVLQPGDRLAIGPVILTVQIDGVPEQITPVKTPAELAAGIGAPGDSGEVIDLEADVAEVVGIQDSDPISALEALAAESDDEDKDD